MRFTRTLSALAATGALLAGGLVAAPVAQAAPTVDGRVSSASLTWGVKSSFRSYVKGKIAKGSITVSGGAKQAANNGAFTFTSGSGSVLSGKGTVTFKGAVKFTGHKGQMNLALSDVKVQLAGGGKGYLVADAKAPKSKLTKAISLNNKRIATVKVATSKASGGKVALKITSVKLTSDGSKALAGFYPAGTVVDSASVSGKYAARVASKTSVAASSFKKGTKPAATLTVARLSTKAYPTGKVTVSWTIGGKVTKKSYTLKAANKGKLKVTAPKTSRTAVKVKVSYAGNTAAKASASKTLTIKTR
ncbi:MAG: HtaA domain-containing protein [Arthrobacter sp.]|jgi:hypothetical protein|nr:HtaA domain-containing protein [Arthrobacter sp.]